jgi:TRAP transporter TAXI family solute receptor
MVNPPIAKRLREIPRRDLLVVGVPSLLLLVVGFWLAAQFIRPAPPSRLILSSGGASGAYQVFAARYREILARYHIELVEKPSGGATDNLARLRDEKFKVDAAFVQGGLTHPGEDETLLSLGSLYYEPVWFFYRSALQPKGELDRISQLKGRRIAIGTAGSGTHYLANELLSANGISAENAQLLDMDSLESVEALQKGSIDAVFVVGPTQSAAVWLLLYSDGVRLMSHTQADAYIRRFPYLSKLTLPQGAVDLVRDIPSHDITLVSPMATLVVREDTHPALIDLLMQAATEVHGGPGIFQRPGEFPNPAQVDFPLSKEADRYYKSGKPFLQRYLPFWAATLIDRMIVLAIPLLAILLPIVKFAPTIYSWRVRSRIYRRYGELKFLETDVDANPDKHSRAEWMEKIDGIEAGINRIPTPLAFADMLYTLRSHISLVRETVVRRTSPDA